jgi:putative pyoverdin transport system ATP-binding/permease protein
MQLVWRLLTESKWNALVGSLCGLLAGLSSARIAVLITEVVQTDGANLNTQLVWFILAWIGYAAGSVASAFFLARVTHRTLYLLRLHLGQRILASPLAAVENDEGKLLTILGNDVLELTSAVQRLPGFVSAFATFVGCVGYLAWQLPMMTAIFVGFIASAILTFLIPYGHMGRLLAPLRDRISASHGVMGDLRRGLKDLLQSPRRRQDFVDRQFEPATREEGRLLTRITVWETIAGRWGELYLLLGLGGLIFTLPALGIATFAEFGVFIFIVFFLLGPIGTIASSFTLIRRVRHSIGAITSAGIDLDQPLGLAAATTEPSPPHLPHLEMLAVSYAYSTRGKSEPFILGPIDITFDRPEIVFVTGGNGSGKSTFLKLLTGLYPPTEGRIRRDHTPVDTSTSERYRELFTVIFADTHIFPVLLGEAAGTSDQKVEQLLRKVALDQVVTVRDGRFSTTDLSTGQRKRLALVQALASTKSIFVFDEWAADQDPHFRRLFYDRFLPRLKEEGKLVIAITHDELYFNRADRIIHLQEGRLATDERQVAKTGGAS